MDNDVLLQENLTNTTTTNEQLTTTHLPTNIINNIMIGGNNNTEAAYATQVYESVGGMIFNYYKASGLLEEKSKLTPSKLYEEIDYMLKNEEKYDLNKYYYVNGKVVKNKYETMMDFILLKRGSDSLAKKLKTTTVLLKYYMDKNNDKSIKKVSWNGQSGDKSTTDVIIHYDNNTTDKVSLKEGKTYYLLNSTFNILIDSLSDKELRDKIMKKFVNELIEKVYSKVLSKEDSEVVRKVLEKPGTRSLSKQKAVVQEVLDKMEKEQKEKYQTYYEKKIKIEIAMIEELVKTLKKEGKMSILKKFIKKNIVEKNLGVKIVALQYTKNNYNYIEDTKLEEIIEYLSKENEIKKVSFENDNDVSTFYIIIEFEDGTKIKVKNTLRSDKAVKLGHKLVQYNNKYNISKITKIN